MGLRSVVPLLLLACLAGSCGAGEGDRPQSAVLITLDTTRRDALTCYGAPPGLTPNLDALAAESALYDEARTVAPITLPAHASMLTGLYPLRHTVRDNGLMPLPAAARTVAERAREAGFQTAAFVAAVVLDRAFGLDQGFEVYDQPSRSSIDRRAHYAERDADEMVRAAAAWLARRDPERPYLLWVHFFDPHAPHSPPKPFLDQAGGDPYLADVAHMDAAIGKLLAALRRQPDWDRTLVVVVGDHGEGLGAHGEETHSGFVFDTTLRVPFLVRHPDGWGAGERLDDVISVADVHPTLVEALGLGTAGDVDGQSLFRRRAPADRGVYFESYHGLLYFQWSTLAGWTDAASKYVHTSAPELYDLGADPGEETNLFPADPGAAARHRAALAGIAARPALEGSAEPVDPALLAPIEKLGYAGSGGRVPELPDPLDAPAGASPHGRAEELRRVMEARFWANQGRHAKAVQVLRGVLEGNPRNHEALSRLGLALMALERFEQARETLLRFVEVGPEWPGVLFNLGQCCERLGQEEEALEWFRRAVAVDPQNRAALGRVIGLLERQGRFEEAIPYHKLRLEGR